MDPQILNKYQPVIGLEVHIQLLTESKLFASDRNSYGHDPNTNISTITLGHPGTLPKLNKQALELAIKMGLACGSDIAQYMIFDRKNYFYPDLPKGYQLTQDRTPICMGGAIEVQTTQGIRSLKLNRIHLEEDAGKSFHQADPDYSLIDYNRAGTPLIELVTEPVLHDPEEAFQLLYEIRRLVTHLGICSGNMEQGALRCDANVSIRPHGEQDLGTKVEIKNMNSMRNVRRAISHEIERQIELCEAGTPIVSETRTYDEKKHSSSGMRTKEELNDYRYFPEPDLSPVVISDEWLSKIKAAMPPLPNQLKAELMELNNFSQDDATFLTDTVGAYGYFKEAGTYTELHQALVNWMKGPIQAYINESNLEWSALAFKPKHLSNLAQLVDQGLVSFSKAAQNLLPVLLQDPDLDAQQQAQQLGILVEKDNDLLESSVKEVLEAFPDKVKAYKSGKKGLMGFFMGQLMQVTGGKVDPKYANELFTKFLD